MFFSHSVTSLPQRALALFWRAFEHGGLCQLKARLTRTPLRLLDLDETLARAGIQNSCYAGIQAVNIDLIQGTQCKQADFDIHFHPLTDTHLQRWLNIAMERLRGHELPPVDLVEAGGVYYVRDGHHRISVARSLGQAFIEAEVIRMHLDYNRFL